MRLLVTPEAFAISLIDAPAKPRSRNRCSAASRIAARDASGSWRRAASVIGDTVAHRLTTDRRSVISRTMADGSKATARAGVEPFATSNALDERIDAIRSKQLAF